MGRSRRQRGSRSSLRNSTVRLIKRWGDNHILALLAILVTLLVGILTVFIMYGQYQESKEINGVPPPTHPLNAQLHIVDATIRNTSEIVAEYDDVGDQTTTYRRSAGPVIDIRVHNKGSGPALITEAELRFNKIYDLRPCFGAGPLLISARYDVTVPRDLGAKLPPRILRKALSFEVKENSFDRFVLTVGPSSQSDGEPPQIYEVDLNLVEESGRRLAAGRFTLISPHESRKVLGNPASIASYQAQHCVDENQRIVEEAVGSGGKQDEELLALRDAFKDPSAAKRFHTAPLNNVINNAETPTSHACIVDKVGDLGYRVGAAQSGLVDIRKFCADFRRNRLRLRVDFVGQARRNLDMAIEVRMVSASEEYILQSSVPLSAGKATCFTRSPTGLKPDCGSASVEWASKGLTVDIGQGELLKERSLTLSISLFSGNRNQFGGYDGSDLVPDKSELIVSHQD